MLPDNSHKRKETASLLFFSKWLSVRTSETQKYIHNSSAFSILVLFPSWLQLTDHTAAIVSFHFLTSYCSLILPPDMDENLRNAARTGKVNELYRVIQRNGNVLRRVDEVEFIENP
ncbi:alpha-latrotoxin-Lhe1a-like [Gossypium australe]|uniref:Alpha-latrotoxin-Lhe1a-like n=1 Tax=Gossypium australe TaxID=47621 RepID=A0A5B6VW08_9ROSI|nr:alpha-latrotoxin-Lhe1a-like [Gossypium australe]